MLSNENFSRQVQHLSSKLVSALTNFDERSLNHESCIEFSLSNFQYHRFLSPNSDRISRQINGLVEKFLVHSQPEKSKCLKESFDKFLKNDLSTKSFSKSSVHYSLLSILLELAEYPLNHEFEKSAKVSKYFEEDDFDWTAYLLDGEDCPENYPWDESPYDSEESDSEKSKVANAKKFDELKTKSRVSINLQTVHEPTDFSSKLVDCYWTMPRIAYKSNLRCSLDRPLSVLQSEANITETNVIREVLWLLSGHTDLFLFPEKNGKHTVSRHASLSHLTNQALQEKLKTFILCGDIVKKLRNFVFSTNMHTSNTYEAFASSLSLYLNWLMKDLLEIEKKVREQEETFLVQDLHQSLVPHTNIICLLSDVYDTSISCDKSEDNNVARASRLLGVLCQTLQDESALSKTSTQPSIELNTTDVLFNLWIDSAKTYIDIIDCWISKGILQDDRKEFVIFRKVTDCQQPNFWNEAVVLFHDNIAKYCPWLTDLLPTIITGGKSMEILKTLHAMAKKSEFDLSDVMSAVNEVLKQSVYEFFLDNVAVTSQSAVEEKLSNEVVRGGSLRKRDVLLKTNFVKLLTPATSCREMKMDKHFVNNVPLSVLITNSLQPVIELKCNYANKRLVEVLKDHFKLLESINEFHNFHLMALGDVMHHFSTYLCENLLSSDAILSNLVEVNILMQEALSYCANEHKVFVHLKPKTNKQKKSGSLTTTRIASEKPSRHHSIGVTDCIELQWRVEWPVTLILNEKCVQIYNKVFSYLLQIKRALYCVESLKFSAIYHSPVKAITQEKRYSSSDAKPLSADEKRHRMAILRARFLHLLQHWHGFVMTSVIQAEKHVFSQRFANAQTLDDVQSAHNLFLERILSLCLLDEQNQASKLVQGTLKKIMTSTITFNMLWNCGINLIQDRALLKHEADFHECSEFLGRILKNIANRGAVPILDSLAYAILS